MDQDIRVLIQGLLSIPTPLFVTEVDHTSSCHQWLTERRLDPSGYPVCVVHRNGCAYHLPPLNLRAVAISPDNCRLALVNGCLFLVPPHSELYAKISGLLKSTERFLATLSEGLNSSAQSSPTSTPLPLTKHIGKWHRDGSTMGYGGPTLR